MAYSGLAETIRRANEQISRANQSILDAGLELPVGRVSGDGVDVVYGAKDYEVLKNGETVVVRQVTGTFGILGTGSKNL